VSSGAADAERSLYGRHPCRRLVDRQAANEGIGRCFERHRPVAGACRESVELALQLQGHPEDERLLAESIGFGLASIGLLTRQLQLAVVALELANAGVEVEG